MEDVVAAIAAAVTEVAGTAAVVDSDAAVSQAVASPEAAGLDVAVADSVVAGAATSEAGAAAVDVVGVAAATATNYTELTACRREPTTEEVSFSGGYG